MFQYRKETDPIQYAKPHDALQTYLQTHMIINDYNENLIVLDFDSIRIIYNLDEKWDPWSITSKFKQPILDGLEEDERRQFRRKKNSVPMKKVICVLSHPHTNSKNASNKNKSTRSFIMEHRLVPEIFHVSELQYNVTKHALVPLHQIVIDKEERENIKKSYQVEDFKMLPLIFDTDPIVRFIGGKSGDLIRIIRNPNHVGEHTLYRFCVAMM